MKLITRELLDAHAKVTVKLRPLQTDATSHNIVACCWGFSANNVVSVCMGILNMAVQLKWLYYMSEIYFASHLQHFTTFIIKFLI